MLLIIVGFYVLLKYDMLLISPGRWQQGKTATNGRCFFSDIYRVLIYNFLGPAHTKLQ